MDKYPLHRTGATGYNETGKGTRYVGSRVFPLPRSKGKEGEGEMREILFRGKRTDNGEWVYGNYCIAEKLDKSGAEYFIIEIEAEGSQYYVIPETVGQFTGIIDENGKKVFEGDILDCITSDFDGSDKFVQYTVTDITNFEQMGFLEFCHKIEVIGNIHRTPQNDEVRE